MVADSVREIGRAGVPITKGAGRFPICFFIAFTTLLVGLSGWVGYRWERGPEPALEMPEEEPRQRPQGRRQPRESQHEDGIEVIRRLKRDEFLLSRDLRRIEAWNHVNGLSLAQIKEALAITERKWLPMAGTISRPCFFNVGSESAASAMAKARQLGDGVSIAVARTLAQTMADDAKSRAEFLAAKIRKEKPVFACTSRRHA